MRIIRPHAAPVGQAAPPPAPEPGPARHRREVRSSGYINDRMEIMRSVGRYLAIAVLSMFLSTGVLMTREAINPRFHITEAVYVRPAPGHGTGVRRELRPTSDASELWIGISLISFAAGMVIAGRSW
jgi:hypothetical protein